MELKTLEKISEKAIETHISRVFLAGKYAYKIKKAVNFGFLDFSTLAKRKFYCQQEVRLNRRLSPILYQNAADYKRRKDYRLGGNDAPAPPRKNNDRNSTEK